VFCFTCNHDISQTGLSELGKCSYLCCCVVLSSPKNVSRTRLDLRWNKRALKLSCNITSGHGGIGPSIQSIALDGRTVFIIVLLFSACTRYHRICGAGCIVAMSSCWCRLLWAFGDRPAPMSPMSNFFYM